MQTVYLTALTESQNPKLLSCMAAALVNYRTNFAILKQPIVSCLILRLVDSEVGFHVAKIIA